MKTSQFVWPVIKRYDREHLARVALPLGGIGTGTVSLGGRGDLRDWEIVNRPAKGFAPRTSFVLWAKAAGKPAVTRCLEGPIPPHLYEGCYGTSAANHGLPRFREASFAAAYPLGQVLLRDPEVPLEVRLEGFNPLVSCDADASGIPVAVLRYVLINRSARQVEAAVGGSLENFIGRDGTTDLAKGNINECRQGAGLRGVYLRSDEVPTSAETWGTMALAVTQRAGVTCRTAWADVNWGDTLLDFWDDFAADGKLEERPRGTVQTPVASVAARVSIPPRSQRSVTFLLGWHFPNRQVWHPKKVDAACACSDGACSEGACGEGRSSDPNRVGNYYTTRYADAWDVVQRTAGELKTLERRTLDFVEAFCASSLPEVVKEAALFNLSALRTQTVFRTEDGLPFGWEGCADKQGCCEGNCTHVWNYEQVTPFLFGRLARQMREIEFLHGTDGNGHMAFRINLPLGTGKRWPVAAADGQMGCIMKLYREWKLSGDRDFLQRLWPQARKAMEFCWIENGWDGDRDGVMEGCQHNSMDVEYFGPNPQMQAWYLGALRAAEEMARYLGEEDFAATCRTLFENGRAFMDEKLFNGEYYEHEIRPPGSAQRIAAGLRHENMGARDLTDPELQLGSGCLIDQLIGQTAAHLLELGYLLDEHKVRRTLASVLRHNWREKLWGHFNQMRSFALQEESALLMCTYPRGRRPQRPFPYYNEVMTGFEYAVAVHLIYEGMEREALRVIAAVRQRYDGAKRSPFNEAECGNHYVRSMASWGAVPAWCGFEYSAVTASLAFAAKPGLWCWSSGDAWGTCTIRKAGKSWSVDLAVLCGTLAVQHFALGKLEPKSWPSPQRVAAGKHLRVTLGAISGKRQRPRPRVELRAR